MIHECEGCLPEDGYGGAISSCYEHEDGTLWAGNAEYSSQVAFCPYCGFAALVRPDVLTRRSGWKNHG